MDPKGDPSDYMIDPRPAVHSQLSTSLPGVNVLITGHDEAGKSKLEENRQGKWRPFDDKSIAVNDIFTVPFDSEADIAKSDEVLGAGLPGIVREGGIVAQYTDFKPGYECVMHRTSSVDFAVVLEGELELVLEDGSRTLARRGDTIVQRGTMHAWRNPTESWARLVCILSSAPAVKIEGKKLEPSGL